MTDIIVGIADYNVNDVRSLGTFELLLVAFTLLHDNITSALSLYGTEEEIISIKAGKADPTEEDWIKHSQLRYAKSTSGRLLSSLWPFRIRWEDGMLTLLLNLLYNMLSIILLRPIVDRLLIFVHTPSSHRLLKRRKAEQCSLKNYFIIIENFPELMLQFYAFQKIFIQFLASETEDLNDNLVCKLIYPGGNNTNCNLYFRVYSMVFPFCNIPRGIVSLEQNFRELDPLSLKLPSVLTYMLYLGYFLLTPSRLFLISSLMRVGEHPIFYVGSAIFVRLFLNCLINTFVMGGKDFFLKKTIFQRFGNLWNIIVYSFRDCFVISLRKPAAYLTNVSGVTNDSMRSFNEVCVLSVWFILEGFIGAVILEKYYKYQESVFKYTGWLCLLALLVATTLLLLVIHLLSLKYGFAKKRFDILWGFVKVILFAVLFLELTLMTVFISEFPMFAISAITVSIIICVVVTLGYINW